MRGRVFSIKAMAFAVTILATMLFITEAGLLTSIWPWLANALEITEAGLSDPQKREITLWMPRAMFMLFPLVFVLSWAVDIAIWARRPDTTLSTGIFFKFCRVFCRVLVKVLFRFEVVGAENFPKSGPVVVAANHASFIDPILLGCATDRTVQYIMYSSYYRGIGHPFFRFLKCIPVDESGRTAALKAGMRSLKEGACIGIFPEGHVSEDGKLQPPQGGMLFLAQRSGAPIIPVALKGNYEAFPRHAWLPRFSKIKVIVGKPFHVSKDLSREETAEKADELMQWFADQLGLAPPPKSKGKAEE
jgi:1-acyl-sn-glycerol-3-phosphate acyltransferase